MNIAVYGSLTAPRRPEWEHQAAALGRELARRGHTFLFGGGGTGLLGAAAKAAQNAGGSLLAVVRSDQCWEVPLPGAYSKLTAEGYRGRKQRMEELAEGFLVLPGGIGTLDECVEALILESRWKPVAIWNLDGCYDGLRTYFRRAAEERLLSSDWQPERWFCDTPEQIWRRLEKK